MVRIALYPVIVFIALSLLSVLTSNAIYAQTACQSISGCTLDGPESKIKEYNLDADGNPECVDNRQYYLCSGTRCYQDSTTCSETVGVCNNGAGNTPNDGYTCNTLCNDLAIPANCGNYAAPDLRPTCSAYVAECLKDYCKAAGGGTNYTCPSPQECVSPPDAKAHQCITPVVTAPTVTLTVNNVFALTVNKGDGYVLAWNIGGSSSTCTNNWGLSTAPTSGPGSGTTTDSKQDAGTYVYTLTCSNSAGTASLPASSLDLTNEAISSTIFKACLA